jgi:hypothetical protein
MGEVAESQRGSFHLPRPRYPLSFTLFEDKYPEFTDEQVVEAMNVMDEGYLTQGYYKRQKAKIRLEKGRKESFTYEDYSWTEHISRKGGPVVRVSGGVTGAVGEEGIQDGVEVDLGWEHGQSPNRPTALTRTTPQPRYSRLRS